MQRLGRFVRTGSVMGRSHVDSTIGYDLFSHLGDGTIGESSPEPVAAFGGFSYTQANL